MTMILVFSILAMVVSLFAFGVAMASWQRHDMQDIQRKNIEQAFVHHVARVYEFRNTHDQALKDIAVGLKRTIGELCYVRDQFYATQSQQARPLHPEATEAGGEAETVQQIPLPHLRVVGRGSTDAAAVRAAEAAGVRADGDDPRDQGAAQV